MSDDTDHPPRRVAEMPAAANLIFNINVIPFAGIRGRGAAAAMVVHPFLFCRLLPADRRAFRISWPGAAAALYPTDAPHVHFSVGAGLTLPLAPILFAGLLWMGGFLAVPDRGMAVTAAIGA